MVLLLFVVGLFIGSFLGVLVDRLPRNETVIEGKSRCEFCKKDLGWLDLIPVFSFVFLKGKCRYCKHALPFSYPVIEIVTGSLFAMAYLFFNLQSVALLYYLVIISSFIVIFFMDLTYGIISDKILICAVAVNVAYLLIINPPSLLVNLLCGLVAFLFFLIISLLFQTIRGREGMGGGDIKLSFLLGLFLGFPNIIVCLYIAFLTGAALGIILILWKKKNLRSTSLPFGPFLISGALISLFWGNVIYAYVIRLLGF